MKIALTGASSTGKTTLVKELLKQDIIHHLNLVYVSIDARSIIKINYGKNNIDLLTDSEFEDFQQIYYENKIAGESKHQNFITDRSFADAFVYLTQRVKCTTLLEKKYKDANSKYDYVIYLPFGSIPFENDGHRSINMDQHNEFASLLESTLSKWASSVFNVTQTDIKLRVDEVVTFIKEQIR